MVNLTSADISDSADAQMILDTIRKRWPWVRHLFADAADDHLKLMDKAAYLDFVLQIIRWRNGAKGFEVLPRRWVVERTFGWMVHWRRLVRDYERRIDVSKAMILVAIRGISSAEMAIHECPNRLLRLFHAQMHNLSYRQLFTFHGLMTATPAASNALVSRVATVKPCEAAIAAI